MIEDIWTDLKAAREDIARTTAEVDRLLRVAERAEAALVEAALGALVALELVEAGRPSSLAASIAALRLRRALDAVETRHDR